MKANPGDGMAAVRRGINLIFAGVLLIACAVGVMVLGPLLVTGPRSMLFLGLSGPILMLASSGLTFAGKVSCMSSRAADARGMIGTSVALDALVGLISLGNFLIAMPPILGPVSQLASVAALLAFLLYLKRLSASIGVPALTGRAEGLIKVWAMLIVTFAAFVIGMVVFPPVALAAGLVSLVLAVVGLVRYIGLIVGFRRALNAPAVVTERMPLA